MTRKKTGGTAPEHKSRTAVIVLIVAAVLALLAGGAAAAGIWVGRLDTIYPNLYLNGTPLGGLRTWEAAAALDASGYNVYEGAEITVRLPLEHQFVISAEEIGAARAPDSAAEAAFRYGREGGFLSDLLAYMRCLLSSTDLTDAVPFTLDDVALHARISEEVSAVEAKLMEADLRIGETHVTVVKGSNAIQLDKNLLFNLVADAFSDQNWADIHYDGGADAEQKLDVESLYDAVYAEPANAEYDPETGMATPHVTGRSFDLALARQLWSAAEPGELVSIPLILEEPEVTTDSLNDLLFSDLLGQKSTSLGGSSNARINNIQKAALAIDGLILNPGEEFSYNEALGERTAENGYQPAGAYSGGKVVTEYGGGICQVSSTLYYVALLANLEITDRTCHYFGVGYLPAGLDATVSWGGPEFKFRNNREFPVRIEAYTDMEAYTVVVKIWGTDVDGSYVELSAYTWPTDDGYGAQSYRLVYAADGTLISQEPEARSIYHYEKEEEEEEEEDPEATESPEPSESPIPTEAPEPSAEPSPSEEPTPPAEPPVEPLPEYPVEPPVESTPPTEEPPAEPVPTPEESYPAEPVPTPEESYPAEPVPTPGESYPAEPFTPSAAPEESHPAEEYPAEPFTPGGAPEPTQPVEPPADENAV